MRQARSRPKFTNYAPQLQLSPQAGFFGTEVRHCRDMIYGYARVSTYPKNAYPNLGIYSRVPRRSFWIDALVAEDAFEFHSEPFAQTATSFVQVVCQRLDTTSAEG